jgi:DNA processing protein
MFDIPTNALLAQLNDDTKVEAKRISSKLIIGSQEAVMTIIQDAIAQYSTNAFLMSSQKTEDELAQYLFRTRKFNDYVKSMSEFENDGIDVITFWDTIYPKQLREIETPPLLLYVRGNHFPGEQRIAIVGTRTPTPVGKEKVIEFAKKLSARYTIVSGLALGIDAAAHMGALEGKGQTIAILGNQVNTIYPRENLDLASKIMKNGSIVTELTSLAYMHKGRFIERNRIISGVSSMVIVGEASRDGGTIHQVRLALEQKRPVFVIDHGRFQSEEARGGFEKVVKMGGIPITDCDELFQKRPSSTQSTLF